MYCHVAMKLRLQEASQGHKSALGLWTYEASNNGYKRTNTQLFAAMCELCYEHTPTINIINSGGSKLDEDILFHIFVLCEGCGQRTHERNDLYRICSASYVCVLIANLFSTNTSPVSTNCPDHLPRRVS